MIEIRAGKRESDDMIDIRLVDYGQKFSDVKKGREIVYIKHQEGFIIEPICTIDIKAAQSLMDSLYNCGIRPAEAEAEAEGSASSITATKNYLEDLESLILDIKIKLKRMES